MKLLTEGHYLIVNKTLLKLLSVNAALLLSQLVTSNESFSKKNMLKDVQGEKYFFITSKNIQEEISLSYKQQKRAIDELEEKGFIKSKLMSNPAKKHFHVTNKIFNALKVNSSNDKRSKLDMPKSKSLFVLKGNTRLCQRSMLDVTKGKYKLVHKGQTLKYINKINK